MTDALPLTCPRCQALSTIPIVYGKPVRAVLDAAERGLVELGGCAWDEGAPNHRCVECKHAWNRTHQQPLSIQRFADDSMIVLQKLLPEFERLVEEYGAACVSHGQKLGDASRMRNVRLAHDAIDRQWAEWFELCERYFRDRGVDWQDSWSYAAYLAHRAAIDPKTDRI